MASPPFRIGKYEVVEQLGAGGMGTVYRAWDTVLERMVALKMLHAAGGFEEDSRRRFLREARSVARLQHPNIITVFDFGEVEERPFIVMELLSGTGLDHAVENGRVSSLPSKLHVVEQLCRGLGYAHGRGVIHRDVKPSNVFLLHDETVKLLDFGIAFLEGGTVTSDRGTVMGTPNYMAPEQFAAEGVDHRVDVWSVGVILYELLTGDRPFAAKSVPSMIFQIIHSPPMPIDADSLALPPALVECVNRALTKDPAQRYPDMEALRLDLSRVQRVHETQDLTVADAMLARTVPDLPLAGPVRTEAVQPPTPPRPTPAWSRPPTAAPLTPTRARPAFREAGTFGERQPLQVIALTPDEQLLAVGGVDGSVRFWDLATRTKLETLRSRLHLRAGHGALTTALAFSRDGRLLASGHLDGSIYLWNAETGLEAEAALRHEDAVAGLAFAEDGATLYSGGLDAVVKCWEVAAVLAGEPRRVLRRQPAPVTALTVAGEKLVSGHASRVIRVQELASGRLLSTLHGHAAAPSVLLVVPGGQLLVSGGRDRTIRVFSLADRLQLRLLEVQGKTVSSLALFPGGQHLAAVAMDRSAVVWDLTAGEVAATLWGEAEEAFAGVVVMAGGQVVLCGLSDGRLRAWER